MSSRQSGDRAVEIIKKVENAVQQSLGLLAQSFEVGKMGGKRKDAVILVVYAYAVLDELLRLLPSLIDAP